MEEDIKILEQWLKELNILFQKTYINNMKERKALENLLNSYKELERENQVLKNTRDMCPAMGTSGIRCDLKKNIKELEEKNKKYWKLYCKERDERVLNSIPTSVIQKKKEQLEERIKNPEKTSYWASYTISECIGILRILQEILEEGRKLNGRRKI